MPRGVPTPMENVPPDQPRDHAWHWGTVLGRSPNRKRPSRFPPPAGDLVLASVAGFLLGHSIAYAAMRDGFPVLAVFAAMLLLVHAVTLGIAQMNDETRATGRDWVRIAATYGTSGLLGATVTIVLLL